MVEKRSRSILKMLTWRMTGTIDTIVISLIITRNVEWAVSIGLIEVFTKMILYYFHERIWNKLNVGRSPKPDYQI